jgi:nitric oxide reductase NorQ protein
MTFVIDPIKKALIAELVETSQNVLLTGGTGCGKTTLCKEIAEELNMNCVIVNCGSTQDARTTLMGFHTLEDGNTNFTHAEFISAIQTPNTLIILDELSRASDDAYNIIFPLLDFRREIHIEETNETIKVADGVRFISTANVGLDYSSTRSIDRALQDRFMIFNVPYLTGKQLLGYIKELHGMEVKKLMTPMVKIYEYTHKLFADAKLSAVLSPRMILNVCGLISKFKQGDVLDHVLLSMFEQDSSSITNDANIIREFADSLGMYKVEEKAKNA